MPAARPASGGFLRRLALAGALLFSALLSAIGAANAQADSATIKATFVYRFASFVQWPADAPQDGPITLCVAGSDPLRRTLERVVRNQHVGERAFAVRQVGLDGAAVGCHVLYLAGDEDAVRRALRETSRAPVLTITDADATPDVRGAIHFVLVDNRVRFHIDDARAADNGLIIDPRLLNLAISVRRRGSPG